MAPKSYKLFSCTLLLLLLIALPTLSHAKPSSPFEFLKPLEGCHKGENKTGLHNLKKYLKEFGYLDYHHTKYQSHAEDDEFDDLLESALKTYQLNYHLNATGTLDAQTVAKMVMPRCGVADIANGTNWMMRARKNKHQHGSSLIRGVSHYSFFPNRQRWPASQTHLTFAFSPNTPSSAMEPVARAFSQWASRTHFTFSRAQDYASANIKIGFHRGDHGDGLPFDGRGGVIAHAFAPTDGRFHYDADELFSIGPNPNAFDLQTVALHEIGHLLGLEHSSVQGAIMWPSIDMGVTKGLHPDDIQGIKALYNIA